MKKSVSLYLFLLILTGFAYSCIASEDGGNETPLGKKAKAESAVPIRPGIPGERPFWNAYAERFIYAPAFDYKAVENADQYLYKIYSAADSTMYDFKSKVPYAALSPVWAKIPVGYFDLEVVGISGNGDSIGLAGKGRYYRASPYDPPNGRVYHTPVIPYDSSAKLALDSLMHKSYVSYWLTHKLPDPDFKHYRYPSKMMGSLIVGAVTYANIAGDAGEVKRAKKIAAIVANYLLGISEPKGAPLEYFPPTYYGYKTILKKSNHMKSDHIMMQYGAYAGQAYLDLYDLTGKKKYLVAAKRIGRTYLKSQLKNGTWYLFVDTKTGKPLAENMMIPTKAIRFLSRLQKDYLMEGLQKPIEAARSWIMDNPVKTFNWQGQFEDTGPTQPYKDQTKTEACGFARYLFNHNKDIKLAKELLRYSEDQFVVWEKPKPINKTGGRIHNPKNWITPSAQEQYNLWVPVTASFAEVLNTYWAAYKATGEKIYLAKARSLANSLTLAQQASDYGTYPTYGIMKQYPDPSNWINVTVLCSEVMLEFGKNSPPLTDMGKG